MPDDVDFLSLVYDTPQLHCFTKYSCNCIFISGIEHYLGGYTKVSEYNGGPQGGERNRYLGTSRDLVTWWGPVGPEGLATSVATSVSSTRRLSANSKATISIRSLLSTNSQSIFTLRKSLGFLDFPWPSCIRCHYYFFAIRIALTNLRAPTIDYAPVWFDRLNNQHNST